MKNKLYEILQYYKDTYNVSSNIDDVYNELISNGVEVFGDSFYCEIETEQGLVLLAGTKESADMWVIKKIINLIKSGRTFFTMFNGNSNHLINMFGRYDISVVKKEDDMSYIVFNGNKE